MATKDLKEALLTLRSVVPGGEEAYKALLTASAELVRLMAADFLQQIRLGEALESEQGAAMEDALEKASKFEPWFGNCTNIQSVAIDILRLRLIRKPPKRII